MISQITAESFNPASLDMSTAASVWPALVSTPPSHAIRGNTCPGLTISPCLKFGFIAAVTVSALSNAEMPVVMLVLDSIEMVNAVVFFFQLSGFIKGSFNSSALVSDIDRQIKPLPWVAMKLICSGLQREAGIIKSPSFSLSSLSTRIYILPLRASSIIFSIFVKSDINLTTYVFEEWAYLASISTSRFKISFFLYVWISVCL